MTTILIACLISCILCLLVFLVGFAVAKETKDSIAVRRAIRQQGQSEDGGARSVPRSAMQSDKDAT